MSLTHTVTVYIYIKIPLWSSSLVQAIDNSYWCDCMLISFDCSSHCTSIVAEDANHTIWHGRNLDYDFMDILDKCVIDVNFTQNNKVSLFKRIIDN